MASLIRSAVSKKKKRFTDSGYDLDLTYITPRIIAMGFPSSGQEAYYRNPLPEVQRFFNERHHSRHKIYNLCSERSYSPEEFHKCERFPFDDHNPSPLDMIGQFCANVKIYLNEDHDNVVAIHCKAGKGRTGMMIACLLLHLNISSTADAALLLFGKERTHNSKGVTIPSQIRYVYYYEQLLKRPDVKTETYRVTHIRLVTVPNFDPSITGGGCDPYFMVRLMQGLSNGGEDGKHHHHSKTSDSGGVAPIATTWKDHKVFNYLKSNGSKIKKCYPADRYVDLDCSNHNLLIRGDTKLNFYDYDQYKSDDKMCHLWFHTAFIERNFLVFDKPVIDKACKDKGCRTFDKDFKIEVYLHKVGDVDNVVLFSGVGGEEGGGSDTDSDESENEKDDE